MLAAGTCTCGRAVARYAKSVVCLDMTPEMLSVGMAKAVKPSETVFLLPTSSNPFTKVSRVDKKHYWDSEDGVGTKLMNMKSEFILVHNHPNNTPLSLSDLMALNDVDKMKAIVSVGHDGKICAVSAAPKNKFTLKDDLEFFDRAFACSIRDYGQTN